jgi:hypothetical protein
MKQTLLSLCFYILCLHLTHAQITWPEGQLLPSFPAPAATQDLFFLRNTTPAEMYLFSSLKGLINSTQPRLFSYEGDSGAEGEYTWLNSLKINYNTNYLNNPWGLLSKYKSEISGLIVYDTLQNHTVNLATVMAKELNAVIASPTLLDRLQAAPYNFPILADLRGQYTTLLQVYQKIFDQYWNKTDKRLLIGLSPDDHQASLREYAIAIGAAVIYLDPDKLLTERPLLNKFLDSMPDGANYMGWWPAEQPGVERASYYGITTIASDFCTNLTFHSGFPREIIAHPMPAKPALENKIYVAFIISDGDNLQYVEHRMRRFWDDPNRGSVPVGWTISPAMVDAMPGALNYFHKTSTDNDNLISGPSGYGYTYPNYWLNTFLSHVGAEELADFAAKTEEYNVAAGIRVITVWNTITNGIDASVGTIFAGNSPTLLGLTAQNTGGALSIYGSSRDPGVNLMPGKPLSCNYCTGEQAMIDHIDRYSEGWNGNEPRFLIIQGNPWNSEINPTGFKNIQTRYSSGAYAGKYVFVRPDHIFQLIRQANGLTINPGGAESDGDGLTGTYYNGVNFDTKITSRVDTCVNFNWGLDAAIEGANADNFSVRWLGQVTPRYTGLHTFYLTADHAGSLWVNNEPIITSASQGTGTITLTAGEKYDLKLEYFDQRSVALCQLEWASPLHSREIIPKSHLFKAEMTGIKNTGSSSEIKIYSTTKGIIDVETTNFAENEKTTVTVYDLCGKALWQQNSREAKQRIDLSHYPKGIYLISVNTKQSSKTIRHLIN